MTFFGDLEFFIYLALLSIPAALLGVFEKSLKYYRVFISAVTICLIIGPDKRSFLFLASFYILEYGLIRWYLGARLKQKQRSAAMYRCVLLVSILPLVLCKISEVTDLNVFQFLGISYLTFRVIQMIIEIYDGVIKEVKWLDYSDFLLLFATFSSGPIDRSRRYLHDADQVLERKTYIDLLGFGIQKIMIGAGYKFVLSAIAFKAVEQLTAHYTPWQLVAYSYSYGIYMFFDFAGYSAMAIGAAAILGIRVPENFNKPFISTDMKDFWNRWHMTLSFWFRDFVFSRIMMGFIKKKYFASRLTGASIAFLINMTAMGIWHGLTWSYVLYGLYHGILLAATEIYQKKSKFYKQTKKKKWYVFISWAITINCVMFGFLIFSGQFTTIIRMILERMV
ncbi:MAG: D-alanyl-lipoteichoic acid biosynthesis protein DltB [Firmicutes bacterium]|nr:D-alanyl-lipoteichoic acid biosynthesis protein DltB [Bacillota bacterium]